ncbi:CRISPR-associated endonuclease Cas1 [Campylobacterota bacterium]|nr:CRISPR-associated endonuclease Cas1 [Campylobacterota bacterium]
MSFRTAVFSKPCRLSIQNANLRYQPQDDDDLVLPLEDMLAVVIESEQTLLTAPLLTKLAQNGTALFVCDNTHMPCGVMLPFLPHSRNSQVAHAQIEWSEPFKKRIWQKIVRAKILNQAALLKHLGSTAAATLYTLANKVDSGDTKNIEAEAAVIYWRSLFIDFSRRNDDIRNSALNYVYSIVRGAIARNIAMAGLIPTFGVHHSNQLNAFNLADDLIEPFRAIADMIVVNLLGRKPLSGRIELSKTERAALAGILGEYVLFDSEKTMLLEAVERTVFSLVKAGVGKKPSNLLLPEHCFGS